jgi:hypothetical protein
MAHAAHVESDAEVHVGCATQLATPVQATH